MLPAKSTAKHSLVSALALAALGWAFWQAARAGYARTLAERAVEYQMLSDETAAADHAVAISQSDAETHSVRGEIIQRTEDYEHAVQECERAVQLRPRDYYLWLMLGVIRDQNHDQEGAMRALRQSAALAPVYAQPSWQVGNLLLRMGDTAQAFVEFRRAAASDPTLLPNVIDLAWGVFQHNPQTIVNTLHPETDTARLALAQFFAQHDQGAVAADQFCAAQVTSGARAQALLNTLMAARDFRNAYRVWTRMHGLTETDGDGLVRDGGFEEPIELGQTGFGWQIAPNVANVTMSVDASEHYGGSLGLRIEFDGNSNPTEPLLSQIVLVKPETRYRLSFASECREFTSAGAPIVTVSDGSDPKILFAQSSPIRPAPQGWQTLTLNFMTEKETHAVAIAIARQTCSENTCPAFGTVWLDSFSIANQ